MLHLSVQEIVVLDGLVRCCQMLSETFCNSATKLFPDLVQSSTEDNRREPKHARRNKSSQQLPRAQIKNIKIAERTRLCPPEHTTHGRQRSTWNPRMRETRPARLSITRRHRPNSSNWHSCKLAPELKNTPTLVIPAPVFLNNADNAANLSYRPFPHVPQRSIPVRRCKLRIRTAVPRPALSIG